MSIEERLLGTWKLVSLRRELTATGEEIPDHPRSGFLTFAPGGRVSTILVWQDRLQPAGEVPTDVERAALHKSLIAFAGTYRVTPEAIVMHVELSWNGVWTGTEQVRFHTLDGHRMTLRTEPHVSATDGRDSVYTQVWEKVA